MVLKAVVENLDDLSESIKGEYKESKDAGGKTVYVLDIADVQSLPDVGRLNTALIKERNDHKATKNKLGAWSSLGDPEEVQSKLDRLPELEAASKGKLDEKQINDLVEGRIKGRLAPLERERDQLKTTIAERDKSIGEYTAKEKRSTINGELNKAAKAAKVTDTAIEDIELYGERMFEINDAGAVVTKDGVGVTPGLSPKEWLADMQKNRPHWWGPTQGGGAVGSRGGNGVGKNPFSRENWNMTEQGQILREKGQAEAERMAKLAGTTLGGGMPPERKQAA